MVRQESAGPEWFSRLRSRLFYKVLNLVSPGGFTVNASDFFLLDHRVCELLRKEYRERARFLRGIVQVVGFARASLPFEAPSRVAGTTKYSTLRLVDVSITAMATFSRLPLRLALVLGLLCGGFSLVVGIYSLVMKAIGHVSPGYTTIVVLVSFMFAAQFVVLGIIGEYLGCVFDEVKRRPIYVLESLQSQGSKS
jgi:dolichol-phosphate mannosyltransferase